MMISKWASTVIGCVLMGTVWTDSRAAETTEEPLADNWLYLAERALVFDVRHDDLVVPCRQEAGELVQGLVRQLVRAGYTIHFSRDYVRRELEYYEARRKDEPNVEIARQVEAVLRKALGEGRFDWAALRTIHIGAPNTEAVNRHLPWLYLTGRTNQLVLETNDASALPRLEFTAAWKGLPIQGLIRTPAGHVSGLGFIWKIDAWLRLHRGERVVAEKHYPAPAWQSSYSGFGIYPLALMVEKIMSDMGRGLANPPPPLAPEKPPEKKKRRFLFFK